jgi:serine/threonine protein kinase
LSFAAFIGPFAIDHFMIPMGIEEDILGEGVTFLVTEALLPLPLSRHSKKKKGLVALKRVKAPLYLIERVEKKAIEKVCFELRVLLHEAIRSHANVVDILCIAWEMRGSGSDDRTPSPVLIMEHAAFGALSSYQATNKLTWEQKRRLCLEIACGLEVLHDSGIIHGDVKSENVLLSPCERHTFKAKLSDFGCSFLDDDYDQRVLIVGTRVWSAPEILLGPVLKQWAPKTDVYSFGLLSFQICVDGRNPFWALPLFDLDPDLSQAELVKQIQEIKLRSDFLEMCLEYANRFAQAHLPLAEIMKASLSQKPQLRQDIRDLAQKLQMNIG